MAKPLPQAPIENEISSLTADAADHLADIVRYNVKVRSLAGWDDALEKALSRFAEWLTPQSDVFYETRLTRQASLSKLIEDTADSLNEQPELVVAADASLASSNAQGDSTGSTRELISRLYKALQTQGHGVAHLLVTAVAPPAALTAQELDFQVVPASRGCSFEASLFSLPFFDGDDNDTHGDGGSIVTGLDLKDDENVRIIGGSFRFQGLTSVREYQELVDVLSIGVYCITSNLLEMNLLQDSGVKLIIPSKPVAIEPASPPPAASTPQHPHREKAKQKALKAKEGLWSYLTKHSETIFARARTLSLDSSTSNGPPAEAPKQEAAQKPSLPPFSTELQGVKEVESALSTSPGLSFSPPTLLTELAKKEEETGRSDVTAGQHVGLRSLLGWSVDHHLSGPQAFVRHQCLTTLYSEYVPVESESSEESMNNSQSLVSWAACVPRKWRTYRYFSKHKAEDQSLGEFVVTKCSLAPQACNDPSCKFKGQSHQLRWVTGRTRIIAKVHKDPSPVDSLVMWLSCHECGASSKPRPMTDATWILSFGKYLELLAYSDKFAMLSEPPCEHTSVTSRDVKDTVRTRSNIIRHFAYNGFITSFSTSPIQDVYDLRLPRVQITKVRAMTGIEEKKTIRDAWQSEDRAKLRLEITSWWKGVKEHLNQLEELLDDGGEANPLKKPLPPSPPFSRNPTDEDVTPKASTKELPALESGQDPKSTQKSTAPSIASTASIATTTSSLAMLNNLRQSFNTTEQLLYSDLSKTSSGSLNDVRRSFHSSSKAAASRLAAWEKKHTPGAPKHSPYPEPDWWVKGSHALPGGNVIVQEGDWVSMIAFTLSSGDYNAELLEMSKPKASSSVGADAGSTAPTNSIISSKSADSSTDAGSVVTQATSVDVAAQAAPLAAFVTSMQAFATPKPAKSRLDPDDESRASDWHYPETLNSKVSRREHPKDGSNIMSLRDVLRNKVSVEGTIGSRFTNLTGSSASSSKLATKGPPSADASVELDVHPAQGSVGPMTPDAVDVFEQLLRDSEGDYTLVDSLPPGSPINGTLKPNKQPEKKSSKTDDTTPKPSVFLPPPALPPKDWPTPLSSAANTPGMEKTQSQLYPSSQSSTTQAGEPPMTVSTMGSLTSTIANAMRFVLNVGGQDLNEKPLPYGPHALMAMESPDIDSRPHIRYDCVIGKRLKFSCTVYYAKQFDSLRRRCGIDEILIQSLKKTENWSAEGGKSKSNFWKTSDDRFIIKTLLDAWNVADLQVLIELGPSYFRYMDKTTRKPSVMAKLLGFFTVEIKNLETGAVQSKADLLIMENLFYERKLSQTFDLKGIEGRKVKPSGKGPQSKTMFDGEWIEGQKKALILLNPHSKTVLEEGIAADADFLASSNIMDYSLLLGVDSEQKHIACGLVDTIGSYTFAKTLEYKAKQNIRKEVTVVPPNEYRDRFVRAINSYFVACPDKWSHPGPDFVFSSRLPSVI